MTAGGLGELGEAGTTLRQGLVVATHGRHVVVETATRQPVRCHLRGKRSEAVVGDRVRWRASGDEGVIEAIEPRRNLLKRQDDWRTKSFAANLDALLVLVAVQPPFAETQLARALIAAASAGVPAWIGLNKIDLDGAAATRERLAPYRTMGVEVVECSLKPAGGASAAGLDDISERLAGRTTLVLGPSGMGKSTLINRCVPQADAQVGDISRALNAGRHTTTATRWYWLGERDADGALIDSPGFQEFGLKHLSPRELAPLMPDLAAHLGQCRFHNCSHLHEPGCGVRAAAEAGEIAPSRWRIYGELHAELSSPSPGGAGG
jgi:ribosome biogenesis GTPase / thiamine phosphate phosphatase